MTLQQAKDQVARGYKFANEHTFPSWEKMEEMLVTSSSGCRILFERLHAAAELYCLEERKRTWDEACSAMLEAMEYTPKPEFKP